MRTAVLHYFHTFHPEAEAEIARLSKVEAEVVLEQARRGEPDAEGAPRKQRASAPLRDLDAELAGVRELIAAQRAIVGSGVVRLVLRGLSRGEFRRVLVEHPAREDDPYDKAVGYNVDSFGEALIAACLTRTENLAGEAVPNGWDRWADEMTNGQWDEIFTAALQLTNAGNPTLCPR